MGMEIRWVKPPSGLAQAYEEYAGRVAVAVQAVACYVGQKMHDEARRNAPWQDRTGNARGGLFYAVDGLGMEPVFGKLGRITKVENAAVETVVESWDGTHLILTLGHTMYYGKFLETAHGAKYAIVMSTIETNLPVLERMLQDLFGGGVGASAGSVVSVV
jgi:hypothetical protein